MDVLTVLSKVREFTSQCIPVANCSTATETFPVAQKVFSPTESQTETGTSGSKKI